MEKINVITLGCAKNVVDSEHVMAQLAAAGYRLCHDSDAADARIVIINTCGFIGDAKEESINMILDFAAAKERGEIDRLYVIGCLSERYRDELRAEIPEVDSFFGARTFDDIVAELGGQWRPELETQRLLTTPGHYAYVKIAEGCNWGCGYCAIPLIRGRYRSVPVEAILEEARNLAAMGVRELMVIAQDTTYWGMDIYGERRLGDLLRELCKVEGIEWIRLHYTYPAGFPQDVMTVMAQEPKICKYIDIPLQHISESQLGAMRRGISRQESCDLIERLRAEVPGIAIRTTLLVGYPGEGEEDYAELVAFVERMRFERLGVFPYSAEEGTYSERELADDVPQEEKERRAGEIMELQSNISLENNVKRVGKTLRVIVDRREGDFYVARSQYDSPEVDQEILIPVRVADGKGGERGVRMKVGSFYDVTVTSADQFDLYAEPAAKGVRAEG